jgi:hypothetical protein
LTGQFNIKLGLTDDHSAGRRENPVMLFLVDGKKLDITEIFHYDLRALPAELFYEAIEFGQLSDFFTCLSSLKGAYGEANPVLTYR